jgi:hypothetical protein
MQTWRDKFHFNIESFTRKAFVSSDIDQHDVEKDEVEQIFKKTLAENVIIVKRDCI